MKIKKTFYSLLRVGIGTSYFKFLLDYNIISYIIIDSICGYFLVTTYNKALETFYKNDISYLRVLIVLLLPFYSNILEIIYSTKFIKKKLSVVNNIVSYLKELIKDAPNEFHEKFDLNQKYEAINSNLWGFDNVVQLIISMISSLIKIITISITLSYNNYSFGLLILFLNTIMLVTMPYLNNQIEKWKQAKIDYEKIYGNIYYETMIFEENRKNPIIKKISKDNINNSIMDAMKTFQNRSFYYKIESMVNNLIKSLFLLIVITWLFYKENKSYILLLLLNQNMIFGFADLYLQLRQEEVSNKRHMEDVFSMLEFLDNYYKTNQINIVIDDNIKGYDKLILEDFYHEVKNNDKKVKTLKSRVLEFNFKSNKNIILIDGKTGSGKTVLTKVISGFLDSDNYKLRTDRDVNLKFKNLEENRIVFGQQISEYYTYNNNISISLKRLYPNVSSFQELSEYLDNFNIENKIVDNNLDSCFTNKLSGGEKQRVVLSSIIWKIIKTNPEFIILDEPEKGIDESTMINIMDYILKSYNGVIFLITHNERIKKHYNYKIQNIIKYIVSKSDNQEVEIIQNIQ